VQSSLPTLGNSRAWRGLRTHRLITNWDTTPRKLRVSQLGLVLGMLLAGVVGWFAAIVRVETTREIAGHLQPLNAQVTTLYRSLADADTMVAAGFLAGRVEPQDVHAHYDHDLDLATSSLVQAGIQGGGEQRTAEGITEITRQLPIYTGLVERARANNRQGLTVGVAYLRLASDLMQHQILPQVAEVQQQQAAQLDDAYRRAKAVPVVALVVCGVCLAGLVWAQIFLFHRTPRVFNIGLVTASAAVLVSLVWWTAAVAASAGPLNDSCLHSLSVSKALGSAQIAALQARTAESLGLVRTGTATELDFTERMHQLAGNGGALNAARRLAIDQVGRDVVEKAATAASSYFVAHQKVRQLDEGTKYAEAVEAAVSHAPTSAATAFDQLDKALIRAVDHEQVAFGSDMGHAQAMLRGLPVATGIFALAAAVGAAVGIRARLEEYR
jgi:hypothetical protein